MLNECFRVREPDSARDEYGVVIHRSAPPDELVLMVRTCASMKCYRAAACNAPFNAKGARMIKHIVAFRFKPEVPQTEVETVLRELSEFQTLAGHATVDPRTQHQSA